MVQRVRCNEIGKAAAADCAVITQNISVRPTPFRFRTLPHLHTEKHIYYYCTCVNSLDVRL